MEQLHHEIELSHLIGRRAAEIVDVHDVRVTEAARCARLHHEAGGRRIRREQVRVDEFDRDRPIERALEPAMDAAHPSDADELSNLVAIADRAPNAGVHLFAVRDLLYPARRAESSSDESSAAADAGVRHSPSTLELANSAGDKRRAV